MKRQEGYNYGLCREEGEWSYVFNVTKTNCKDKVKGHVFELITDKEIIKEVRKQHPKLKQALWKCPKCNKVKESM